MGAIPAFTHCSSEFAAAALEAEIETIAEARAARFTSDRRDVPFRRNEGSSVR